LGVRDVRSDATNERYACAIDGVVVGEREVPLRQLVEMDATFRRRALSVAPAAVRDKSDTGAETVSAAAAGAREKA
jgi:hypothetical protein